MAFCTNCGSNMDANAHFCTKCGKSGLTAAAPAPRLARLRRRPILRRQRTYTPGAAAPSSGGSKC